MEDIARAAFSYVLDVLVETGSQIFVLFGPGLVLALGMYYISDVLRRQSMVLFGYDFWVYFTAIGTVIHELGHVLFAVIFGHRLGKVNLFGPDGDALGYVNHAYDRESIYQVIGNFFIGVGPIILGSIVIFFSSILLFDDAVFAPFENIKISAASVSSAAGAGELIQDVWANALLMLEQLFQWNNLTDWRFYVFLYLVLAIGTHLKLSPPDIKGAWTGFIAIVALVFMFNLITLWMGDFATALAALIAQSYSFFYTIMIFCMVLSLFFIVSFAILVSAKRILQQR